MIPCGNIDNKQTSDGSLSSGGLSNPTTFNKIKFNNQNNKQPVYGNMQN